MLSSGYTAGRSINRGVRIGFIDKMKFELRFETGEGLSQTAWGQSVPGRGNSQNKDHDTCTSLVWKGWHDRMERRTSM